MKEHKNVILVDQRAHGLSEGHALTFGKKEQYDVVSWINYVKQTFGENVKITIVGVSMGATAILAASDKIDERVKIIADAPYVSVQSTIKATIKKLRMNEKLIYPLVALSSILFCHMTLKCDISESVSKSKNRILIIHGSEDTIVPYKTTEAVYLANKDHVQYKLFDGIGHGLAYLKETKEYQKVFFDFINN